MPTIDRQDSVLNILQNLRDLDGLKRLFWEELNYERENRPLSPRQWPESARQPLAEDPILFATGGEDNAFHVVYCRLESDALLRGHERPIVNRLTREHPYALFVFSNKARTDWHFLNVKYDAEADLPAATPACAGTADRDAAQAGKRRLLRRISVRPGAGLRTAAERLCMVDLVDGVDKVDGVVTPLAIQSAHDDAFDVEKVSKDFYREIANWYFWTLKHVTFPKDAPKEQDGRDHISVIRLITRLIFCWFIREKGLIPDVLFDEPKLAEMLDGFAPGKTRNKDSVFYRAILQNLFFATLNTEMDQRGWRRADQNFMAHSLYRHKECFRDPKAGLEWFKDIPFLNGGLFECLDRDFGEGAKPRYLRVDGFSDRDDSRPTVPDFLFFGSERDVDLSEDYGDKKFRSVRVRGLIDTLNRYKFTIEENTPFDQEVALDPELCGKVFENLLAAYNPETGTTARKATGSFYTPREIVDYMVDESLVAYLKGKLTEKAAKNPDKALRALLAYDGEPHGFDEKATDQLIDAIDSLKALDPAVGSGAFPMGILHKLVLVLGKLDPDNERWKAKQIAKLDDATMREDAERLFRENYDDYGRKLYLIENCIYGVDIQPIAVQIAKMRFFISLIVDQKVNPKIANLGVRALPNLETKFVAANTLIGIDRPAQMMLRNPDIDKKEAELRQVREKHFTARTLKSKAKCREDDKRLRSEIAEMLKGDGWDNTTARQLAAWDPYDQNAQADFFDPEWMFGINDGFSVVMGNPPYISALEFKRVYGEEFRATLNARFESATGAYDYFVLFIEIGLNLCADSGLLCYISPNKYLAAKYATGLRQWLLGNASLEQILDVSPIPVFDAVAVYPVVSIFAKADQRRSVIACLPTRRLIERFDIDLYTAATVPADLLRLLPENIWGFLLSRNVRLLPRVMQVAEPLSEFGEVNATTTAAEADAYGAHLQTKCGSDGMKVINTGTIDRYAALWGHSALTHQGEKYLTPYLPIHTAGVSARRANMYKGEKVVFAKMAKTCEAVIDLDGEFASLNTNCFHSPHRGVSLSYIGAVCNSQMFMFLYDLFFGALRMSGGYYQFQAPQLRVIPIPRASEKDQKAIAEQVNRIIAAKKGDPAADTSDWERQIDERVYQLYGLTADEIKIVEGAAQTEGGGKK